MMIMESSCPHVQSPARRVGTSLNSKVPLISMNDNAGMRLDALGQNPATVQYQQAVTVSFQLWSHSSQAKNHQDGVAPGPDRWAQKDMSLSSLCGGVDHSTIYFCARDRSPLWPMEKWGKSDRVAVVSCPSAVRPFVGPSSSIKWSSHWPTTWSVERTVGGNLGPWEELDSPQNPMQCWACNKE